MPKALIDLLTASMLDAAAKGDNEAFASILDMLDNPERITEAYDDADGDLDEMFSLLKQG
jgi:hypothetical protein